MKFGTTGRQTFWAAPLTRALLGIFLCAAGFAPRDHAQAPADGDVSGTTWDCRIDLTKKDESGRATGADQEDHVFISFNPGGASVSAGPLDDPPALPTAVEKNDWSFGAWKQEGTTIRTVSNGTVESFEAQPWKEGDAEEMIELKVSGEQMRGLLRSHSGGDTARFECRRHSPSRDPGTLLKGGTNAGPQQVPAPPDFDVRVSSADSRLLTDAEMSTLRDSLHWEPEVVRLLRGGSAVSNLVDNQGRKLGSIQVQWTKTVVPKGGASQSAGPPVGSFSLQIANGTSCGFLGQAELDDPKGSVIVSSLDLDSWVGLDQPGSGRTIQVEGDADLPSANPTIMLKPLAVGSTLSACMTPKKP